MFARIGAGTQQHKGANLRRSVILAILLLLVIIHGLSSAIKPFFFKHPRQNILDHFVVMLQPTLQNYEID